MMNVSGDETRRSIGDNESFDPVPYIFRIPDKWKKVGESSVLSPPNWLLLDHTIAVVWALFNSSSENALDIDDLKWAYEYLKEVRNAKGENPPDVKTCLTEIQNRLIAQYAQLTDKGNSHKTSDVSEPDNDAIVIVKPARGSNTSEEIPKPIKVAPTTKKETKPVKDSVKDRKKFEANGTQKPSTRESATGKKIAVAQQRRVAGLGQKTSQIPSKRFDLMSKESSEREDGDSSVKNYFTDVFQRSRNTDRTIGSDNLARKKTNAAIRSSLSNKVISESNVKKDSIQSQLDDGKISLQFKNWITAEEMNQNEEQAYQNLKNEIRNLTKNPKISKDEVLKFLSNWREGQVERLQSELKRLNSIEEFMKSFQVDGFIPYVPEDVTQKLESLTYKKKLIEQS